MFGYDYKKPGGTVALPKLTFARKFKPWNLLITSGVWIDDIDAAYHATLFRLSGFGLVIMLVMAGLVLALSRNIAGSLTRPSPSSTTSIAP